jgi:hypothetical protein
MGSLDPFVRGDRTAESTNGHTPASDANGQAALIPLESTTLAALDVATFEALDSEVRARWRQLNRGLDEAADGAVHLAIALARMYEGQLYRQAGYPSFEAYLQEGPRISKDMAYQLMRELMAFVAERLGELRAQISARRRYLLTQIYALDATALDTLLALPPIEGQVAVAVMPEDQLSRKIAELEGALNEAYDRYAVLADKLKAEQQIGKTVQERFEQIQKINQEMVLARDKAERYLGQAEDEIEQAKKRGAKTRKELEGRIKELEQQNAAANQALRRAAPTPACIEHLVVGNDPTMLANLVQLCADGLRRYRKSEHPAETIDNLAVAIGTLIEQGGLPFVVQALRGCAAALRDVDLASEPEADSAAVIGAIRAIGPVLADVYAQGRDTGHAGNER